MSNKEIDFLIENIEVIKANYTRLLSPFFDRKSIIICKEIIYSYNIAEWKKDKVWEYLNDDIDSETFFEIANYLKK